MSNPVLDAALRHRKPGAALLEDILGDEPIDIGIGQPVQAIADLLLLRPQRPEGRLAMGFDRAAHLLKRGEKECVVLIARATRLEQLADAAVEKLLPVAGRRAAGRAGSVVGVALLPFADAAIATEGPAGEPEIDYPLHDRHVPVTACGRICLHRKMTTISTVMAGQFRGIMEAGDGIWLVGFMTSDLG